MPTMTLRVRLGPLVFFEVEGESCSQIAKALEGYKELNHTVEAMFGDLAERVYPEGVAGKRQAEGGERS